VKAIIFAAGMSSRLEELTKSLPKSCLEIDSGVTMIERNLLLLKQNGFSAVTIITGHAAEAFDSIIEKYKNQFENLNTILNDTYKEKNNIYTGFLTKTVLDDQTLILNSDLVIAEKIIQIAKEKMQSSSDSFMLIDDHNKVDEESMKVYVDTENKITRVNKALELEKSLGEYIGALRLSSADIPKFFASTEKILNAKEFNLYYEDAIDRASKEMNVFALSTQGALWTEIDTKEDYANAKDFAKQLGSEIKAFN
jgi:choline kinase